MLTLEIHCRQGRESREMGGRRQEWRIGRMGVERSVDTEIGEQEQRAEWQKRTGSGEKEE